MLARKGYAYRLVATLTVVFLSPIVFFGLPTRLAFSEWFIEFEYSRDNFPKDRYGMEEDVRKHLAKLGLRAVLSEEGMEEFKRARLPDGRKAFRYKEIKHMEDVKSLLGFFFPLTYIASAVSLLALLSLRDLRLMGKVLVASSLFSLFLSIGIALFSLINYELAFELFHNYVFDPYSWRFRYTDTLLRIYPMKLWYDGTIFVLISAGILCIASLTVGIFILRYRRSS
ncbi:MAG TPA: TIGR01906 family membrane protein [Aquificaceae bacterium]|nr:TIGR01906 family membrane protein [Aquificaceae bacterium]HIQ30951.1 TIGR01906 family membrane protein [Aquifex aeolicus]